jgi:predicted DNA binding protein
MLRLEFQMPLDGWLATLAEAVPNLRTVEFDNVVPTGDGEAMLFVSLACTRETDVDGAINSLPGVSVEHCTGVGGASLYRVAFVAAFDDSVLASVVAHGAIPHRLVTDGRHVQAVVTVDDWNGLRDLADAIEREYGRFHLQRTTELEQPGYPLGRDKFEYAIRGKLTADQLEVLRTAYEMGHFAVPQQATSGAVAEALGISRSTFSERVRRAQNTLLRVLFSDAE